MTRRSSVAVLDAPTNADAICHISQSLCTADPRHHGDMDMAYSLKGLDCMPQPSRRARHPHNKRGSMPEYIAALTAEEARDRLAGMTGVLRNPNLSPGEKVTLLVVLDEYERKGLKHPGPMTIDEAELSRLVGYDEEGVAA